MSSTINDRIEIIIEEKFKGNKAAFAKAVGIPPTGMSSYFGKQRRSKPSVDMITKIIKILDIDARWLLLGENSPKQEIHTEGDHSPAVLNGDLNYNEDVEIKENKTIEDLETIEKLKFENDLLKKLIDEKERVIKLLMKNN